MFRMLLLGVVVAFSTAATRVEAETAADRDGDGLRDEHEAILGTDPGLDPAAPPAGASPEEMAELQRLLEQLARQPAPTE